MRSHRKRKSPRTGSIGGCGTESNYGLEMDDLSELFVPTSPRSITDYWRSGRCPSWREAVPCHIRVAERQNASKSTNPEWWSAKLVPNDLLEPCDRRISDGFS